MGDAHESAWDGKRGKHAKNHTFHAATAFRSSPVLSSMSRERAARAASASCTGKLSLNPNGMNRSSSELCVVSG